MIGGFSYDPETDVCYRTLDFMGFPGYRVGDDGSVWSRRPPNGQGPLTRDWRRMVPSPRKSGHLQLCLHRNAQTNQMVHRLVLLAFVGPCPEGMEGCHFPDRNPSNNRVENLRWGTSKSNQNHRFIHGTSSRGKQNGRAKLTEEIIAKIRAEYALGKTTQKCLAAKHGVTDTVIYNIIHRVSWKHVG